MDTYRVAPGTKVSLADFQPADTGGLDKAAAKSETKALNRRLEDLQELLYAEGKHKVLIVLQAMDAAGKDGTIRHVFDRLNPQGVKVASFKKPTSKELAHDYLWRIHEHTPGTGEITIFNRSHYEQKARLQARLDDPNKHWKFDVGDLAQRKLWDDYMVAYETAISETSTEQAPWFIIPAEHKWFRNLVISRILVEVLEGLNMTYPEQTEDLSSVVIE